MPNFVYILEPGRLRTSETTKSFFAGIKGDPGSRPGRQRVGALRGVPAVGVAENAKGGCSEGDSSPYIQRKLPAEARSISKSVLQNNGLLRLRLAMTFKVTKRQAACRQAFRNCLVMRSAQ